MHETQSETNRDATTASTVDGQAAEQTNESDCCSPDCLTEAEDLTDGEGCRELVEELLDRIDAIEARLSTVEAQLDEYVDGDHCDNGSVGIDTSDYRDRAVVSRLEPGEIVDAGTLQQLYKKHTDIASSGTVRERIKSLVDHAAFVNTGDGWRYDPDGGTSQ